MFLASLLLATSSGAMAQADPAGGDASAHGMASDRSEGEIVVTARKRSETLIAVPVVVSAVGKAELERRAVTNLDGISRVVPQLLIGAQGGAVQGGNISLRGIAGPEANPFGDQAVSFNIDGVQIAKSSVRRMTDIDIEQVEVLKGPQALFFGKNSPAGIVSIRTADPTPDWRGKASVGYEFVARELRGEGYISGPLTDTLGLRVAGAVSGMDGFLKDQTPAGAYLEPDHRRSPRTRDLAVRGTLKFDPTDDFEARLKLSYAQSKFNGPNMYQQFVDC
ncbi:MAG: TonB-dependent receptor plug domain-containing protein, partial [Novosphingobium sp.]|nr:TonB-dependent receptor plug domain-containing protein [Novosphingobium sp.]